MAFETFDLGRVLQTAEAIKGMRNQAADDNLRRQYLQTNIAGAQQQQQYAAQEHQTQMDAQTAKLHYFQNHAIETAPDPIAAAKQLTPDNVAQYEAAHGPGSFDQLTPDQVRGLATFAKTQAGAIAGITPKVEWKDAGGQLVPLDEQGNLVQGIKPIAKAATPDAQLSAQTSTANNAATNATSRANNAATVATTQRGQDITAATARDVQGGKVTETQGNAKGFGLRATAANTSIEKMLGMKGFDPTGAGMVKDMKTAGNPLTNWAASSAGQHYLNLAEGFISPILRKESGAAISDSERKQAFALYIPMPGDDAEVIKQKAENRRNAISALSVQAGPGGIPANPSATGGWSIQPVQ